MKKGFTLVEILVTMAIVAIVGTILVTTFTNTLRGSNKSQILAVIKQNGQAVLENMDKTIRGADNLLCPTDSTPVYTAVVVQNGVYTRYRIALPGDTSGTAPADCIGTGKNGCIVQDHPTKQTDPDTGELETDAVFIGSVCNADDPMPRAGSTDIANILTDTNSQTGVQIDSGSFTASKPSGYKAAVTVSFTLKAGVAAPAVIVGQIDPVEFKTNVGLR